MEKLLEPQLGQRAEGPEDSQTDTVMHALARAVASAPDRVFLDFSGAKYTYAETDLLATRFAHELRQLGVEPGQTVATVLGNCVDQVVSWLAINKIGAIWVPLNTAYRGEFLRHQLDDSAARIVIADAEYVGNILAIIGGLPNVELILQRGQTNDSRPDSGTVTVKSLDAHRGSDSTPIPIVAKPDDLSMLIYTSGTTGPSKGCMVSHNYVCNQARQSNQFLPPQPGDVKYTPLPLFHASAVDFTLSAMLSHDTVAIAERFSLSNFWGDIERSGATVARLMASIFPLVGHAPDSPEMKRCYGQLRNVQGAPFPPELRKLWSERFGLKETRGPGYGQTEGVRLSFHRYDDPNSPPDSVGRIADDSYEVVVLDDDDNILPDGEIGEIAFRPRKPHVMFSGYWRRPEDTLKVMSNLWMHTGDLGRIENNYLYFVDRKKDYLRSRGENISSFEIERAFMAHPALSEVAAHPAELGVSEDCLKITAVLRPGHKITEEELCLWALDHVPHFAVPRYIEFRDELPRTPTNKVQKFRLRQEGRTSNTWDREAAGIQVRRG